MPNLEDISPTLSDAIAQSGVADTSGVIAYSGISEVEDAEGVAFTGTSGDAGLYRIANGAFDQPPPDTATNIELVNNPLPYWNGPINVSGGAVTGAWSSPGLALTLHPGAAGDDTYFEQIVRIPKSRSFMNIPNVIFHCTTALLGTAGSAKAYVTAQYLQADAATTTGAAATGSVTLTAIDAETDDIYNVRAAANGTLAAPLDASFLRIRIGIQRDAATAAATGTVDVYNVHLLLSDSLLYLTEAGAPSTYTAGRIYQNGGVLFISPDVGGAADPTIALNSVSGLLRLESTGGVGLLEIAAPGTPASGYYAIYAKTDGILYGKNDAGTEVILGHNIQHLRAQSMGSIAAGASGEATFTWPVSFGDTNYAVVATASLNEAVRPPDLVVRTRTATTVTIRLYNEAAAAKTHLIDLIGIHD